MTLGDENEKKEDAEEKEDIFAGGLFLSDSCPDQDNFMTHIYIF